MSKYLVPVFGVEENLILNGEWEFRATNVKAVKCGKEGFKLTEEQSKYLNLDDFYCPESYKNIFIGGQWSSKFSTYA